MTAGAAGRYPEVWRRRSPREAALGWLWVAAVAFVSAWSVSALDIEWAFFADAHEQAADLLTRMWPPRWSYLPTILNALIETIHIATLGLLLGGTVVPVLFGIASRLWPPAGAPSALAAHFQFIDIVAIALMVTSWTAALTIAVGCCVVVIMKGPAYVADRYDLSDPESPRRD